MGRALIYLDANVIIRFVEGDIGSATPIKNRLSSNPLVVTSLLSRLECRCHPLRANEIKVLSLFDIFFTSENIRILEITESVIDKATEIRAKYGMKTPDAIHLSAAICVGADVFLTGDIKLARCEEIPVETI